MIIIGAKGHAKEILDILDKNNEIESVNFFDNKSKGQNEKLFNTFQILQNKEQVIEHFNTDSRFILGIGGVKNRLKLFTIFKEMGGVPFSVISSKSTIGKFDVILGEGLNIMHNVSIFNDVSIGKGSLINSFVSIHHDSKIGEFCEISPGARILGRVTIGDNTFVGANAVILPDVTVGKNVIIGAGAVVTKNTMNNSTYIGIPAEKIK